MASDTMSGAAPASATEGLLTHLRQLGVSVLSHVAMRVELLSIEVQEEKSRLIRLAISAALVSALLIVSLVLMAMVVLAIYWDTPSRVTAVLSMAGLFLVLTASAGAYLSAQLRSSTTLFAASAGELRRDAAVLAPSPPAQS